MPRARGQPVLEAFAERLFYGNRFLAAGEFEGDVDVRLFTFFEGECGRPDFETRLLDDDAATTGGETRKPGVPDAIGSHRLLSAAGTIGRDDGRLNRFSGGIDYCYLHFGAEGQQ